MSNKRLKIIKFLTIVALFMATSFVYASANILQTNTVRLGIFNSQESAQKFYKGIPVDLRKTLKPNQLWLSISSDISQFSLYYLDISNIETIQADAICAYAKRNDFQCQTLKQLPFIPSDIITDAPKEIEVPIKQVSKTPTPITQPKKKKAPAPKKSVSTAKKIAPDQGSIPKPIPLVSSTIIPAPIDPDLPVLTNYKDIAQPVELLTNYQEPEIILEKTAYEFEYTVRDPNDDSLYTFGTDDAPLPTYSFDISEFDSPRDKLEKEAYHKARDRLIKVVRGIGEGINAGNADGATQAELMSLGQEAFEKASNTYLNHIINFDKANDQKLANDAGVSKTFLHHVKKNFAKSAEETAKGIVNAALSGNNDDILESKVDAFMLSGAQGIIDASLNAARKSDLYALQNLELEYNLNDFEDAYFSALAIQPVYQSDDFKHNIFFQGSAIINEQSVDIADGIDRHTINLGTAYRYLTPDETMLYGANIFFDHQWPYHHSRVSIGVDAQSEDVRLAANYYVPITGFKNSRVDAGGNQQEETALEGYDVEIGYDVPQVKDLSIYARGYQFFRDEIGQDDLLGLELSAEYQLTESFRLRGAFIEENGGRDGLEVALQYSIPLYDMDEPNLALAEMKKSSMRGKIFDKVRRENRIRVGERLNANALDAEFNALSTGLPFDVGGTLTSAGTDIPRDTTITIPNGDFGIINFSNGGVANISASGTGDVILEYNATTITVIATNGGFVQFISGSGGIQTVVVPGGTVNLLGTDIDVTDDGTTTTIQVRAGMIEVVPDVGAAVLNGNQGDVVSLDIGSGATALLAGAPLQTRQEAAFTNLELLNPSPGASSNEAPFISILPELITGPQFVGNNADLRLTFTQPVTVAGTPQIDALVDATLRTFTYNPGASSSTQLIFRHVYLAGDVGSTAITTQNFSLAGGTIIGSSNGLNALTAFTDTILAISDATPPSLISSTPVDGAPNVVVSDDIILNFDETIVAGIGNIFIFDTTDGSDDRVISIGDPQVSIVGSTLTIDPTTDFEVNSNFEIIIAAGVIEDTLGNDFVGLASGDLNFDTFDLTAPTFTSITSNTPTVATTDADTLIFRATFNEEVFNVDATDFIVTGTTATITTVTPISGSVYDLTLSGGDLAGLNATVGLDLAGGQNIADIAANALPAAEPATDETYLVDNIAPVVTLGTAIPLNGALQVARNSTPDITLNFTEVNGPLVAGAGNITLTDTDDGSDVRVIPATDPQVTIAGTTVTIDLTAQMEYAENYEITYDLDFIQDQAGNSVVALGTGNLAFKTVNLEEALTLTLNITTPDNNVDENNAQGSGQTIPLNGSYVMAVDLTIPASPDGLLFECGATGQGQFVGFNPGDGVFRARGGEGGAASPAAGMTSLDIPIGTFTPGDYTLTFEYDFGAQQIRAWLDENLLGSATSIGGFLDTNRWSGGDNCAFATTTATGVTTGETTIGFNGTVLSPFRYYNTQTLP